MADDYIDFDEVFEYGEHAVLRGKKLEGAHPIVAMDHVGAILQQKIDKLAEVLGLAGIKRSDLRGGSTGRGNAAQEGREELRRFWNFILSLNPKEAPYDIGAFFKDGKLGSLAALKADDVKAKVASVLLGFGVPANANFPNATTWKAALTARLDALSGAASGHTGALAEKLASTGDLEKARLDFLGYYNGVAKPVVRALLNLLGRGDEYRSFFKDLTVNEGPARDEGPEDEDDPAPTPTTSPTPVPAGVSPMAGSAGPGANLPAGDATTPLAGTSDPTR